MNQTQFTLAGEIRPGYVVSLTGMESDAGVVTEIQPSVDFEHVEITLETGARKTLPIEFPMELFEE